MCGREVRSLYLISAGIRGHQRRGGRSLYLVSAGIRVHHTNLAYAGPG